MTEFHEYSRYWQRKQLLRDSVPRFPVRRWWETELPCEIERVYFEAIKNSPTLLDIGAGDMRLKQRLQTAGYQGAYDTQDIGDEYSYTYNCLSEVKKNYGAILCMDVIEHLTLRDGLKLLDTLISLLTTDGVLVLQTPNARCVRHPLSTDMTHLHCYNIEDLWVYLTSLGLSVEGYRIIFRNPRFSLFNRLRFLVSAYITTRLLGCDYADNILLIARKPAVPKAQ